MGIYWNSNGKYQEWVDKVLKTMPDMYSTDNEYMNIFIEMSNLYYDIYNNGGCNFRADKVERIKSIVKGFKISKARTDHEYLEDAANHVFEFLMDKDLSFENHGFWNEWNKHLLSLSEKTGEDWIYITCGTQENMEKEFENRQKYGFKVVA